jgi:hypothetical protein
MFHRLLLAERRKTSWLLPRRKRFFGWLMLSTVTMTFAASAYEAATHHRVPPPAFGPLPAPTQTSGL